MCGLRVRLVDGLRVRNTVDVDWTMGGSEARYAYNPRGEIWIDRVLEEPDRRATILHEIVERNLMLSRGMTYDDAHDIATEHEARFRASDAGSSRASEAGASRASEAGASRASEAEAEAGASDAPNVELERAVWRALAATRKRSAK